jgi:putative transcriptional regulator
MISHHPSSELLFDYAAGSLPEPVALAVAAHAALCPDSRSRVERMEAVGGALLDDLPPADISASALDSVLAAIEGAANENDQQDEALALDAETKRLLPSPLWPYVAGGLNRLRWKKRGLAVQSAAVPVASNDYIVRLLRIKAGSPVPAHTHGGVEFTLVLAGGYSDGEAHFQRGDLQIADPSVEHRPVADAGEDCLCFVVLDKPIKLTSRLGRLANPFVKL